MMKAIRIILGILGFIIVWVAVAGLIALVLQAIVPGAGGEFLGVRWVVVPGSVVGVVAGYRAYQVISGDRARKTAK